MDFALTNTVQPNQIESTFRNLDTYDRKSLIEKSLSELSDLEYTILSLYYYEDLSLKEISKIVEKDKNYLKVLLQRARLKLYNGLSISVKEELKELL